MKTTIRNLTAAMFIAAPLETHAQATPSSAVKSAPEPWLKNDLREFLGVTRPEVVYTHNAADQHDTRVVIAALQAMRELPRDPRPKKVVGCEVWRNLDWLTDPERVLMDVSGHDLLASALNGVFTRDRITPCQHPRIWPIGVRGSRRILPPCRLVGGMPESRIYRDDFIGCGWGRETRWLHATPGFVGLPTLHRPKG